MFNNNGSFDSKLAHSVQRDYRRDANNFRLAKTDSRQPNFGKSIISKSLPLASYAIFFLSLFALIGSM